MVMPVRVTVPHPGEGGFATMRPFSSAPPLPQVQHGDVDVMARLHAMPRHRLAERVSAASYGTVLVLAALAPIDADHVGSGLGWELVTGVGVATWLAHFYAEIVGDHLQHAHRLDRREISTAMTDGLPILLAAVIPAVMLLLGRVGVLSERLALWASVAVALVQLVGLGAFVGVAIGPDRAAAWKYAAGTAAIGLAVVIFKLALGH
jgi:VIT1/CCC1 family predicted Fe2+/Mn2+ transporter